MARECIILLHHHGHRRVLVNSELGGVTLGWRLTNTAEDELFAAFEGTALHTRVLERFEEHGAPVRRLILGRKNSAEKRGHQRARDLKVRRSPEVHANRENPGVHCTSGRAGPRGHPLEGALAKCVAAKRSRPRGYPGRGSDWGLTFVHFLCRAPVISRVFAEM